MTLSRKYPVLIIVIFTSIETNESLAKLSETKFRHNL